MTPVERGAQEYLPDLFRYMNEAHGPDWPPEDLGLMVLEDAVSWGILPPGPVPDQGKSREGEEAGG